MNGNISKQTAALLAAVIPFGIAMIVVAVLLIAPAAHAAPAAASQPVQFSTDGVHWSDSYSGALFAGVLLVPGESAQRTFYVRNGAADPASLRVTLYDVATTDIAFANAMTLSTSLPGLAGAPVPVTDARPCVTLTQGRVLAAGDSVRLDNVAALGDLTGTSGQTHNLSFKLAVSLSSTDSAAPAPNSCPTDFSGTVVGSPDPGSGTPTNPVHHLGAGGWTPAPVASPAPAPTPTATVPAAPSDPGPSLSHLVANTERFYQENVVALWLAMAAVGALIFFVVRRRRPDDDSAQQYPSSRQPTTQIGTGR